MEGGQGHSTTSSWRLWKNMVVIGPLYRRKLRPGHCPKSDLMPRRFSSICPTGTSMLWLGTREIPSNPLTTAIKNGLQVTQRPTLWSHKKIWVRVKFTPNRSLKRMLDRNSPILRNKFLSFNKNSRVPWNVAWRSPGPSKLRALLPSKTIGMGVSLRSCFFRILHTLQGEEILFP